MKLQQLMSYTRRALDDYHMIQDGDKIAVGISGGKDSLALLHALAGLKRFYPAKFEMFSPVTYLDRMDLTVIRPFMYLHEADIIGNQENPGVKDRMFTAIVDSIYHAKTDTFKAR